jgi:ATP-dependent DNA helicase RecG
MDRKNERSNLSIQLSVIKEFAGGVQVDFLKTGHITAEVELLRVLDGEMSSQELIKKLNLKHAEHFRKVYLKEALNKGLIERTIPDKPKSPNQKYRITDKGKKLI